MKTEFSDDLARIESGSIDIPSWRAWCAAHKEQIVSALGRSHYARLKFDPAHTLRNTLEQLEIGEANLELVIRRLVNAGPNDRTSHSPAGPAANAYLDGDLSKGDRILRERVETLFRHVEESLCEDTEAGQELAEVVFDAEALVRRGSVQYAVGLMQAVADLDAAMDLVGQAVTDARAYISRCGGYCSRVEHTPMSEAEYSALSGVELEFAGASWLRAPEDVVVRHTPTLTALLRAGSRCGADRPLLTLLRARVSGLGG